MPDTNKPLKMTKKNKIIKYLTIIFKKKKKVLVKFFLNENRLNYFVQI